MTHLLQATSSFLEIENHSALYYLVFQVGYLGPYLAPVQPYLYRPFFPYRERLPHHAFS